MVKGTSEKGVIFELRTIIISCHLAGIDRRRAFTTEEKETQGQRLNTNVVRAPRVVSEGFCLDLAMKGLRLLTSA